MSDERLDREASPAAVPPQLQSPAVAGSSINESEHRDDHNAGETNASIPPFEPLFTLLTNTTTNTTVHPRVHYIFSDDDASVLTTPQTDPSHRALIVDLAAPTAPNGNWSVSWASSLSPDFAVTGSQLSVQQHDGENDGSTPAVMLRVEGVEREPVDSRPESSPPNSRSGIAEREDVEGLVEDFRRRMGVLKKVVGEGERRREILSQQGEEIYPEEEAVEGHDVERRVDVKEHE